jgi:cysteine synthase
MKKGAVTVSRLVSDVSELIAGTPLLRLGRYGAGWPCDVLGKLEAFNPGWSVKDRIARSMIGDAEASGVLGAGGVIIEPTSGNTGIGLAMVAAVRGYRCILCMPSSMSVERRKVLQALGAELVLTEGHEGMPGAMAAAEELLAAMPGAWMPRQFDNPANPRVHYETTGPEIWEAAEGRVDVLVSGVGTGGTVTGTGRYLKERNPALRVVAVEPTESPVLSGGVMGPHMIQGIGAGFVPANYDASVVDEVVQVSSEESIAAAQEFARKEGFVVGISSGAAAAAVRKLAGRDDMAGRRVVAILPDIGERYISTLLFYRD